MPEATRPLLMRRRAASSHRRPLQSFCVGRIFSAAILLLPTLGRAQSPGSDFGTVVTGFDCESDLFNSINLGATFPFLASQTSKTRYDTDVESTSDGGLLYGMYQCRGDLPLSDCQTCIVTDVFGAYFGSLCPGSYLIKGGRVWLKGCYFACLHNKDFFNDTSEALQSQDCKGTISGASAALQANLKAATSAVLQLAPHNNGFYAASVGTGDDTAYALAQCLGYLQPSDCANCLALPDPCGGNAIQGSAYYSSCAFIYSDSSSIFFDLSVLNKSSSGSPSPATPTPPGSSIPTNRTTQSSGKKHVAIFVTAPIAGIIGVSIIILFVVLYARHQNGDTSIKTEAHVINLKCLICGGQAQSKEVDVNMNDNKK